MKALELLDRLGPNSLDRSTPFGVIAWWELRRPAYNLVVGATGIVSGAIAVIAAGMSESMGGAPVGMPDGIFVLAAPILFGLAANVFYTGGWIGELLVRHTTQPDTLRFARVMFRGGVIFSILVTLLPAVMAVAYLIGLSLAPEL